MKIEKLIPECKDYLWGGEKLKEKYGKKTDKTPCAESWELSFHKDGQTKLANGKMLSECVTAKELGKNTEKFPFFPMLIKFIDARDNLSVQVHPSDDYALKYENSFGKTEMWYIVEAEAGAGIYLGFKKDVTKEEVEEAIKTETLTELLNFFEVKAGESYFIPSGTMHAIGKGCLICEIQQNSNLTYRAYDFGRKDKNGNPRELHVEKALKVTNLKKFEKQAAAFDGEVIGSCEYFTARKIVLNGERVLKTDEDSFACVTCVAGNGEIESMPVACGDSYFIPASYGDFTVKGNMELVLSTVEK